ncbi:MAG: VOC family protein [Cyclobacteriaceae bacterium]
MKKLIAIITLALCIESTVAQSEFESNSIQIGVVVENLEKSLDFYKNVIGMKETGGFTVESDFAQTTGLTGGEELEVTVLKLADSPQAAEWKLMSFGRKATHPKQAYITDDTGMQYITIFVNSMAPFLKRIKKAGVKVLSKPNTQIPDGRLFVLIQDPDGNFIELIGNE